MTDIVTRWKAAKKEFQTITGEKKPKPKGLVSTAFGHSGIETVLKECDKYLVAIPKERDLQKREKLIASGEKVIPKLEKTVSSYIKLLNDTAKDEVADKGVKTKYSKGLKFLREELGRASKHYIAAIDAEKIAIEKSPGSVKAVKMVVKSLDSCVTNAAAAIKRIKATPTPEQFNKLFGVSDNPARKMHAQLVAAANGLKKGLIPELLIDPRFLADKLLPWNAGGKGMAVAPSEWTEKQVLAHTAEFSKLVKMAERYQIALSEKSKS